MSKSFLKLVDYSLVPAIALVLGKVVGIILISRIFNISISIREYSESLFNSAPFVHSEDLQTITAYSDMVMFAFVATVFSGVLVQAIFFHDTHVKPALAVRLINKGLWHLVTNTYNLYHAATIHLVFVWVAVGIVWFNILSGNSILFVGIATTFVAALLTIILFKDVHDEIENIRHRPGQYSWV